jgi:hypothetical protein
MLGKGRINSPDRGGSVLSHAAGALEERLLWSGGERLRAVGDAVRWPFERIGWAIERRLLWPLEQRTATWSLPPRAIGISLLGLIAIAIGVGALLVAAPSHDNGSRTGFTGSTAAPARAVPRTAHTTAASSVPTPTLHGAAPVFAPKSHGAKGVEKAGQAAATESGVGAGARTESKAGSTPAKDLPPRQADPAAVAVAHRFSSAFVLYETGQTTSQVRSVFHDTATPHLVRQLLRRPPRLPADVNVPQARVVNVVPGPCLGEECTVSVSLLRVGVTSELRLSVTKEKNGDQRVTDVLG